MNMTMQDAMLKAMPSAAERVPLARQIASLDDVEALSFDDLLRMEAAHDAEIVSLQGRIETANEATPWLPSARRALRALRLHLKWLRESKMRRQAAQAAASRRETSAERRERMAAAAAAAAAAEAARLARIRESNTSTAQDTALFKEVAREVLGAEMYAHLWQLVEQRKAGGA